ncbi:MAG: phosphopantothenoylcysteine decarboxylase [Chitinophagaceae bacterium]
MHEQFRKSRYNCNGSCDCRLYATGFFIKKIKKTESVFNLNLKRTNDILKELGERKSKDQIVVGFALETNNEKENALSKLEKKNIDLIVLNSLNDEGAGFGAETNKISIFDRNGNELDFETKSKKACC